MLGFSFGDGDTPRSGRGANLPAVFSWCLEVSVTSDKCWPQGLCAGWHGHRQVASPGTRVAEF